ncbi:FUSC family protein [Acidimangrovimonas sediminis]|uniref:FUSC family protein n=1 Tax=Acidimangrovimonas sediminis TaxID=2056283 RepID=UPI00130493AD|nr:FUSC family protein [Acidimangrovimonas sediminis]
MKLPERWQIVFTLKAFVAAVLALYISFALGLQRPYWAMTTVYVVAQPFAGAIRSKGAYRICGTLCGAAAGITLASIFGADQVLMMAGLVAWFLFCGYFALSTRQPNFYFFLLAGMTALLIGWPDSSLSSGPIFDNAIARTEEIALGIACAVAVDSIFFPRRIWPVVQGAIRKWGEDARAWSLDVLRGKTGRSAADRARLAADAAAISAMTVHLDYEAQDNPQRARWVRVLQQRMLILLPLLSSVEDRLEELTRDGAAFPAELRSLMDDLADWVEGQFPKGQAAGFLARIEAMDMRTVPGSDWHRILLISLAARLTEFVTLWEDCLALRAQVDAPRDRVPARLLQMERESATAPHLDRLMVFWAIGSTMLAFLISATFWYFSGWSGGATMAMISLLLSLFFGAFDNPVPILRRLVWVMLAAVSFDTFYLFVVLPQVHSFPTLILVLAPALLVLGLLASQPATFMIALFPIAFLSLQDTAYTAFAPFLEGMVGLFLGVCVILAVNSVVKAVGAQISIGRIRQAGWRDLEAIATAGPRRGAGPDSAMDEASARFTARMLDRLGLIAPRLAVLDLAGRAAVEALAETRLGLGLIALQRARRGLDRGTDAGMGRLMDGIARHFREQRRHWTRGVASDAPDDLLAQIDDLLGRVAFDRALPDRRAIVLSLAGIRRALYPGASTFAGVPRRPADPGVPGAIDGKPSVAAR